MTVPSHRGGDLTPWLLSAALSAPPPSAEPVVSVSSSQEEDMPVLGADGRQGAGPTVSKRREGRCLSQRQRGWPLPTAGLTKAGVVPGDRKHWVSKAKDTLPAPGSVTLSWGDPHLQVAPP